MGIKNGSLKFVLEGLSEIMALDLKPKFAYKTLSLYKLLVNRFEDYAKFRNEQILKLAEKDEEGNPKFIEGTENVIISNENVVALNELDDTEVEGIKPILLSELETNVPTIKIQTLIRLGDLVVDDASQNAL